MSRVEIDHAGLAALKAHVLGKFAHVALDMGVDVERHAPVDTGALRMTVHVTELGPELWRISAGTGLPDARAIYNEFGTRYMRAQPFIRPSIYKRRAV